MENMNGYNRGTIKSLIFGKMTFGSCEGDNSAATEFLTLINEKISAIDDGSIYMIDLQRQCISFVSNHNLFLSGYSSTDVLRMDFDFFPKVIYPTDLPLFICIQRTVLEYLLTPDCNLQEIKYFAFNIRVVNNELKLMVYHKMIPIVINDRIMIVCRLCNSEAKTSGNLSVYYRNKKKYRSYSFKKQKWLKKNPLMLTEREKNILKLAKQGKCSKEISESLHASPKTIRNTEMKLYRKLHVHSMNEAIIFATNHQLIFV
jgi:DNA-binding CsgD family transcriptional regulator